MSETAVKFTLNKTSSSNVIPFPKSNSLSGVTRDDILDLIIGNPTFENYLKDFIEGVIMNELKLQSSVNLITKDDPFDPIYISKLQPDIICKDDLYLIEKLSSKIVDKSELLFIDDGWDD